MATRFRHAALVGKFNAEGIREELESVATFLVAKGLAVTLEEDTAVKTGIEGYPRLPAAALGKACDIAVVVGGDGTMLAIARQLARHDTPLVGINLGRLGFITDIGLGDFETGLEGGVFLERHREALGDEEGGHGFELFADAFGVELADERSVPEAGRHSRDYTTATSRDTGRIASSPS